MNTLEIPAKGIRVVYPGEWDEMTRKQAIYAGKLLYLVANRKLDVDQFRKLMVDRFIGRVNNRAPSLTNDDEIDLWGNEWLLAETVNFFFKITGREEETDKKNKPDKKPKGERWEVMPAFTKQLIGSVRVWNIRRGLLGRKFYGPGDFWQGMSFAEYKDALTAAGKYMETNDDAWLDRLFAILYRKKRPGLRKLRKLPDFDGKTRIAYNYGMIERNIVLTRRVGKGIKYMTLMYMMGCLWTIRNNREGIEVDGAVCDFSILFKKGETGEGNTGIGLVGVMMAIAESGVFGNIKDVANADVWDVLVRMYQLELDRRDMEKKTKTQRH